MDEKFDALYRSEERMAKLSTIFTSLAIIIACLGLLGLTAYSAEQRKKEIGIRKVLGASVTTIVTLLSFDFIKLVFISILVSAPPAYWIMHRWLEGFAYRQHVPWWSFAVAGFGAMIIAVATMSLQSIRAALTNPIKSLRSE